MASREAVALEGGRPGTPEVHAQVLSMRECMGRRGRASTLALWRIVVVLDGHQRGMRSTYLTAVAFCKPPSPVSQIAR
jgi:hypothetical protein